jgi:hypothetical protein
MTTPHPDSPHGRSEHIGLTTTVGRESDVIGWADAGPVPGRANEGVAG